MATKRTTSKTEDIGVGGLLAVGVVIGGLVLYNKYKDSGFPSTPEITPGTSSSTNTSTVQQVASFPLKRGSRGSYVKNLQLALREINGISKALIDQSGGADGVFGSGTESALRSAGYGNSISQSEYNAILGKAAKEKSTGPTNTIAVATKAVVKSSLNNSSIGEGLYKKPNPGIFDRSITSLKSDQYAGEFTGNKGGGWLELRTRISGKDYKYWIDENEVKLYTESAFNDLISHNIVKDKTQDQLKAIMAA